MQKSNTFWPLYTLFSGIWGRTQKVSGLPEGWKMYISSHFIHFLFLMAEYPASFEQVIHCYDMIKDAAVFVVLQSKCCNKSLMDYFLGRNDSSQEFLS